MFRFRHKLNQAARAGLYAQPATDTFCTVYHSNTVYNMDGILLTYSRTGAEAEAAITAVRYADPGENSTPAILNADIIPLVVRNLTAALTADKGNIAFNVFCDGAHNGSYFLRYRPAAHRTAVYRSAAGGDGRRHGITARKAAGTAVVARKALTNGGFPFIDIHVKLLSGINEGNADNNTDENNDKSSQKYNLHVLPPVRTSGLRSP
jgi:hypothetical protein